MQKSKQIFLRPVWLQEHILYDYNMSEFAEITLLVFNTDVYNSKAMNCIYSFQVLSQQTW